MKFLEMMKLVLSLFPLLVEMIRTVERSIPQPGSGTQKLALVRELVQAVYDAAVDMSARFDDLWPVLESVIGALVRIFNLLGIFKKGDGEEVATE